MGKIVMPKNSALLNEIEAVLKIYYEAGDWIENSLYKDKLKAMIGDDQYASSYTKKSQITSYFGFTEWENINNAQSLRRITSSGKKMYEALMNKDEDSIQECLMTSLETVKFGRNNYGCPESNSDVEPPSLFIRASLDLKYLTYKEFAYLLWMLEDKGRNYTDAISDISIARYNGGIEIDSEATKYTDCKPIMILVRWGFLDENPDSSEGGVVINNRVLSKYRRRLYNLKVYNIDMDVIEKNHKNSVQANCATAPATDYEQIVFYGVPGSGKSYKIEEEKTKGAADIQKQRVVFHPDYTNADFIGQIIPKMHETVDGDGSKKSTIEYTFKPGPFTTILRRALRDENHQYYLIIEEINRGNAAAIFGDLFQLLDRDEKTEWSCSPVNNDDVNFYIASEYEFFDEQYTDSHKYDADSVRTVDGKLFNRNTGLRLPPNLTIYATMNTNDQNVFTLDNAFNRRFKSEHISNKVNMKDEKQIAQHNIEIEDTGVLWGAFRNAINDKIIESELANAEDKQFGLFFIKAEKDKANITQKDFSNKVLKYLWHDVFKRNKEIFNQDNIKKFEDLIDNFTGKDAFINCFEKSFVDSFDNTKLVKQS